MRARSPGHSATVPGGGGEVTGLAPDAAIPADMRVGVVSGADEMRDASRYLFQHGVDFLKLIATGAVLAEGTEPGAIELSEDEMVAAVGVARQYGSYATAHAHGAEGIRSAIRGTIDPRRAKISSSGPGVSRTIIRPSGWP